MELSAEFSSGLLRRTVSSAPSDRLAIRLFILLCAGIHPAFFGITHADSLSFALLSASFLHSYLGIVGEICDGRCKIEQRNKFSVGETIEIMKPDGENVEVTVKRIINEEGEDQESAPHSKQVLYIELEGGQASPYDILRRQEPEVQ